MPCRTTSSAVSSATSWGLSSPSSRWPRVIAQTRRFARASLETLGHVRCAWTIRPSRTGADLSFEDWLYSLGVGHVYVVAHESGRMFQRCVHCGLETPGWEIGPSTRTR